MSKITRTFKRTWLAAAALQALSLAAQATTYTWDGGTFVDGVTAPNPLAAADTLAIVGGAAKYLNSAFTSNGTVNALDNLYFQNGNAFTNNGLFDFQADVGFFDGGGYGGSVVNAGTLRKSAGGGTSVFGGNIAFVNSGTVDVQSGTIDFASGLATFNAGTAFTGAGTARISNNARFNGAFTSANLLLDGGTAVGNGARIGGTMNWAVGTLAGDWTVDNGATLALQPGNYKDLNASLANQGRVQVLDNLFFQNGNTLTNAGTFDLQGDWSLYDGGGYGGSVVNNGLIVKSSGNGQATIGGNIGFTNNGEVRVASGTLRFASGVATFNAGSAFTGAGAVLIDGNAVFNGAFTSQNLQLVSGTYSGHGAQINGPVSWFTGSLTGDWEVAVGTTLTLQPGNYKYLNGALTNNGSIAALDNLYLQNGNTLTNTGLFDAQGDWGLYDGGGYGGSFVNDGTFRKSSGAGSFTVGGNIAFVNGAGRSIEVAGGNINFASGAATFNAGTQFKGAGQVLVTASAVFNGAFTSQNLQLVAGTFSGHGAQINGPVSWTTGSLVGDWEVAAGTTLTLQPGNYKYLNGALTNNGSIAALDNLYLQNGNTLTNNGRYEVQGDFGVADGGGYGGSFVNHGVFAKTNGSGTSTIGGNVAFVNDGEVRADSGTLQFTSGANRFNDGTRFTGGGQIVIASNASFVGAFTTQNNLTLASGVYSGGDGSAGSQGVMKGNVGWATGTLAGAWTNAAGSTLTLQGGNYKYLNGSLTNQGTIAATDSLYLQNGNTLANAGRLDFQNDAGIGDGGGYGGTVVNTGLIVKTGGSGSSAFAGNVTLVNTGTIDVRSGTVALPAGFTNQGLMTGSGAYAAGTLRNDGHLAPGALGAAPGLLTLNGHYAQSALGSFDVGLQDLSDYGFLQVNGNASLAGTIAVDCIGTCSFGAGTELVVLHSSGGLAGSFASLTMNGFGAGAFSVVYTANDVILQVTQATVAAVPEPANAMLLLAGLAAVGFIARRRGAR